MGTTLTGTTPQDTYDSLIKVTDNGPLSGTAKYLSDGLGNDSVLALSTTALGIGTSSPTGGYKLDLRGRAITYNSGYLADFVSTESNASAIQLYADNTNVSIVQGGTSAVPMTFFIGGSERMRITSAGNVGIGTSSPASFSSSANKLVLDGATNIGLTLSENTGAGTASIFFSATSGFNGLGRIQYDYTTASMPFTVGGAERMRLTPNGLTFNGDTAAANALDDYEEGTWTPTSTTSGYTIASSSGTYTKIGRQVVVRGNVEFSAVDILSTSLFIGAGLPFNPSTLFQGSCRESTATGAMFLATVNSSPQFVINSMDGVSTGSQQAFAINRDYDFTVTYFV